MDESAAVKKRRSMEEGHSMEERNSREERIPMKKTVENQDFQFQENLMPSKARQTPQEQITAEAAARKKLAEMNLLDDFLFGSLVAFPEIGERFVQILLKTIFGREFKRLSVAAQKVYYGTDIDLHGTRLDVCIEPDEEDSGGRATVYDVEPERKNNVADKGTLPRRMRFYHGKIVARSLKSGIDYNELKDVVVIMILPYDPFGLGRMLYTVKNRCLEELQMKYEDGAATLFLYTRGTKGVPSEKLKQFLHYMEESTYDNAVSDELKEVHRMVEIVKFDSETTICCVRLMEKLERSRKEGEARGEAKGKTIGEARGNFQRLIALVCKKRKLGQSLEKIAEDLVENVSAIEPIYNTAEKYAPEYDPEAVLKELENENRENASGV